MRWPPLSGEKQRQPIIQQQGPNERSPTDSTNLAHGYLSSPLARPGHVLQQFFKVGAWKRPTNVTTPAQAPELKSPHFNRSERLAAVSPCSAPKDCYALSFLANTVNARLRLEQIAPGARKWRASPHSALSTGIRAT